MKETYPIPAPLYKKIIATMPIPCVDVVLVHGKKFLLGLRKNKPAQAQWWFPGGRVQKGERLRHAAKRHVMMEVGARGVKIGEVLGAGETIFRNSAQGPASHTINVVFLADVPGGEYRPANSENSQLKWFSKIGPRWHPYVREMLKKVGFK